MPTALVVDDSPVDQCLAGAILESIAYDVRYAVDGKDALEQMAQMIPDLVIADLHMPNMNGLELVAAVKRDYPFVPVVLMTALGSEEIAAKALREGAVSYVPKLKLMEDLAPTVQRIWAGTYEDRTHPLLMHHLERYESDFTLHNDLATIRALTNHLQQMLRCLPLADETDRQRVGVALDEALLNAYYHGNLEIGADYPGADRQACERLARERIGVPPYRDRKIHVAAKISRAQAVFVIRDEGPGFAVARLADANRPDTDRGTGRGVTLMRTIMDAVSFNPAGNEVTLTKNRVHEDLPEELAD